MTFNDNGAPPPPNGKIDTSQLYSFRNTDELPIVFEKQAYDTLQESNRIFTGPDMSLNNTSDFEGNLKMANSTGMKAF